MTKKHLINVYKRAAESIALQNFWSCKAINEIVGDRHIDSSEMQLYGKVMQLPRSSESTFRSIAWSCNFSDTQQIRVLMLLLMAEWVKTDYQE